MGRQEILEQLKKTESNIRTKIENAQQKKNEILENAQRDARKLEHDAEITIKKEIDGLMLQVKHDFDEERQKILKKGNAEATLLKKNASIGKTKELFIKKFEEYIHV